MDALAGKIAQRLVHRALARDAVQAREARPFDAQAEMRLAAAVVVGVAVMLGAVVAEDEISAGKGRGEQAFHLFLYGTGATHGVDHRSIVAK